MIVTGVDSKDLPAFMENIKIKLTNIIITNWAGPRPVKKAFVSKDITESYKEVKINTVFHIFKVRFPKKIA